jgi:hypothetical protein
MSRDRPRKAASFFTARRSRVAKTGHPLRHGARSTWLLALKARCQSPAAFLARAGAFSSAKRTRLDLVALICLQIAQIGPWQAARRDSLRCLPNLAICTQLWLGFFSRPRLRELVADYPYQQSLKDLLRTNGNVGYSSQRSRSTRTEGMFSRRLASLNPSAREAHWIREI